MPIFLVLVFVKGKKAVTNMYVAIMFLMNQTRKFKFLSWNVKGINGKNKRVLTKQRIQEERPTVICLQETKWEEEETNIVREAVGAKYMTYVFLPATGTAGGFCLRGMQIS